MADEINVTMTAGGVWDTILPPATNQVFDGEVNLTRLITHYVPYTVETDLEIMASTSKAICSSAEILLIADGTHTPTFHADFTAWPSTEDWDVTIGTVHKVMFYYDGTYCFYNIVKIE